jgi:hypothetical protein
MQTKSTALENNFTKKKIFPEKNDAHTRQRMVQIDSGSEAPQGETETERER